MRRLRKRFWVKVGLYTLPFVVGFLLLTGVLIYLGESMPLRIVIMHQQRDETVLYRYRYGNRDQQYKTLATNMRRPEVLALGSSRIIQFRAGFFNRQPEAFYNAAAPAWGLPQTLRLLENLREDALPRILLLAIDPPWFNDAYELEEFPEDVSDFSNLFIVNRSFLQDVLGGERFDRPGFDMRAYLRREEPGSGGLALGLRAIRDGHGFRGDGSQQYGDFLIAEWLWQPQMRENHLEMMRSGEDMYIYGDTVSEEAVQQLTVLLDFAASNDIIVIGFLPPYLPRLWDEMIERGNHTYMVELTPRLQTLFDRYDFPFFDFSSGAWIDTSEEDFFDGWHVSELGTLRMYLRILEALPELLDEYSDLESLAHIAATAPDTWDVFGLDNQP
jgi:hypothetical protein